MIRMIAVTAIAFTLGAITKTLAQDATLLAPIDEVTEKSKAVAAELEEQAREYSHQDKPRSIDIMDPYAQLSAAPMTIQQQLRPLKTRIVLTLEERQVKALERIARALEARCIQSAP